MKRTLLLAASGLALLAGLAAFTFNSDPKPILDLGATAPETKLEMADVSGKDITLASAAEKNGLLVIFSCNNCPFVIGNGTKTEGWEGRYPEIADMAAKNEIGMVLVNSNEAKRSAGDSMDDMKKRYAEKNLEGYYVLDANHKLADAFGALTTPHVFLFDGDMKLIYKGAIDDSVDSSKDVKQAYLEDAINAHVNGKKIDPASTKQLGCSIKRVKV